MESFTLDMLDVNDPVAALRARSLVSKDCKLTVWHKPSPLLEIKGWQMLEPKEKVELFHIKDDPMERNNLATRNPEKTTEFRKILDAWWNPAPLSQN